MYGVPIASSPTRVPARPSGDGGSARPSCLSAADQVRSLARSGFDADALIALSQDPDVKAELVANTASAVERGVFGIPTFFVRGEMWFGKDRLRDVEDAITEQA